MVSMILISMAIIKKLKKLLKIVTNKDEKGAMNFLLIVY
jgi:hypothetical protein